MTDRSEGSVLTAEVLRYPQVLDFLDEHVDQWYSWDDSQDNFDYVPEQWVAAYRKALEDSQGDLPWILVSNNGGTSMKLTGDPDELLSVLEKYK